MSKKVDPATIPEVAEFMQRQQDIDDFMAQNSAIFDHFTELAAQRNAALERADLAVRAKQVSCGPFVIGSETTKFNAEKLHELVGREDFLRYGGTLNTITQYGIDKAKFKSLVASNQVPADLAKEIMVTSPSYHTPKPIKV